MNPNSPVWLRPAPTIGRWMKIHLYPDCRLFNDVNAAAIRRATMEEALAEGRQVCFYCGKRLEREGH